MKKLNQMIQKQYLTPGIPIKKLKKIKNFLDNYQYINFDILQFLNKSIVFLTIISIYSILSPFIKFISTSITFNCTFYFNEN